MQPLDEQHLQCIKSLLAAFATRDWGQIRDALTPDVRFHFPGKNALAGIYSGREEALSLLARVAEMTGGSMRVQLHDILANDQHGVLMYTVSAKRGEKSIEYRYMDVYHFRDGRIAEVWGNAVSDPAAFDDFYS